MKRGVRDRSREFLVEGVAAVDECLRIGIRPQVLFVSESAEPRAAAAVQIAKSRDVTMLEVSDHVMSYVSGTVAPPGILAITSFIDQPAELLLAKHPRLSLVLAAVRDPGNLGTILRTCWAAGADAVFTTETSADIYNPKLVRASAGAIFHVPLARDVPVMWLLERLKEQGTTLLGADASGEVPYDEVDMRGDIALVLGNEAWGFDDEVARMMDVRTSIPLAGAAESLNVSICAAVMLFEAVRQRKKR